MAKSRSHKLTIRTATPNDRDVIVDFNTRLAKESESTELARDLVTKGVAAVLADPAKGVYYLAQAGDRVVGQTSITFEWSDWRNGWLWWIQSVYVAPDYRGQGLFRALYDEIKRRAHQQGDVRGLRLYVDADNHSAMEAYSRLGMARANYHIYELDWSNAMVKPTR